MLTVEEPKVPVEENNNSSKQAEVQKTEAQISEKDTNKAINIEKVKEEIEETKQKIEELDIHKDDKESNDNDNDDDDIVIPPPPEFSVPLFTKYIHGRQRSISVSSELSLDSYIDEEGIGSPNLDSSSESVINADGESAVTTEISADVPVHEAIDVPKPVHEEEDKEKEKNNDTNKEIPKDIQASTPSKIEEVATEPVKIEAPVVEESKKDSSLTIETDESHLNVANHVPPPRSSASLSASVTRQEGIDNEETKDICKKSQKKKKKKKKKKKRNK
ncbi:hypothetical protein U3516DRAFT_532686 [Neocallimastix sp. 'constans']